MDELTKLLDGSVEDVKAGIAGKSHDDLLKLKAAETDGKTRKGVIDALDAAIATADAQRAGGRVQDAPGAVGTMGAATATIEASGAPEPATDGIDLTHPAVDANPRAGTSELQNRVEFNDPLRAGHEVVEEALASRAAD